MGLNYFTKKKLQLEQQQTARLNKKRLEVKAQRIRTENRAKIQQEINADKKKITNLSNSNKSKMLQKFGNNIKKKLQENKKRPNPLFSSTGSTNSIYTTSSGSNPYDFSGKKEKKMTKKKGGK